MKHYLIIIAVFMLPVISIGQYIRLTNNMVSDQYVTTFGDSIFWSMELDSGAKAIMMFDGQSIRRFTHDNGLKNEYMYVNDHQMVWSTNTLSYNYRKLWLYNGTDTIALLDSGMYLSNPGSTGPRFSLYNDQVMCMGYFSGSKYIFHYFNDTTHAYSLSLAQNASADRAQLFRGAIWWEESTYMYNENISSIHTTYNGSKYILKYPGSHEDYNLTGNDSLLAFITISDNHEYQIVKYDYNTVEIVSPDTMINCFNPWVSEEGRIFWHSNESIYYYDDGQVYTLCSSCIHNSYLMRYYEGAGLFWMNDEPEDVIYYYDGTQIHQLPHYFYLSNAYIGSRWICWDYETDYGYEIYAMDYRSLLASQENPEVFQMENLNVYPNPASDFINIEISGDGTGGSYNIYNMTGVLLQNGEFTGNYQQVPVNNLSKGSYILHVKSALNSYIDKLIID